MRPHEITHRHHVTDSTKLDSIAASMEQHGWQGRPLLIVDNGVNRALTGSHRYAAAKRAELTDIPVVVVPWETWEAIGEEFGESVAEIRCDDGDLATAFEWAKEQGLPMADEALELMLAEERTSSEG